ncbi:MAG: polysaccharide deacetylase family protein [Candidatus Pacearchaeota archaeon]
MVFIPAYTITIKNPIDVPVVVIGLDTELGMQEETVKLVDFLKQENISITFFVNGDFIEQNEEVAERIANSNNEFASHSHVHLKHVGLGKLQQGMLISAQKALVEKKFNIKETGFRAPYRLIDSDTLKILYEQGFKYSADYHCHGHLFIFPLSKHIAQHPTSCSKDSFIYIFPEIFGYTIDDDFLFRHCKLSEEKALAITKEAFDRAVKKKEIFIFSGHPGLIWKKIDYFSDFIEYAKSNNAVFLTHAQLQELIEKNPEIVRIKRMLF